MTKYCSICKIDYYGNECPNSPKCGTRRKSGAWNLSFGTVLLLLICPFAIPVWIIVNLVKSFKE
jgi:hypothetical protein